MIICLPGFAQTPVRGISDAIQPPHLLSSPSPVFNISQHQSFPVSQLFASGGQSIGASGLVSVLPMNIQGGCPLGLTGFISFLSKGLSRIFSKHHNAKAINSLVLSLLYGPTLRSIHEKPYWKNHSFD